MKKKDAGKTIKRIQTRERIGSFVSVVYNSLLLIGTFVFITMYATGFYSVRGNGMTPSAAENGVVVASRFPYLVRVPKRGDVVIASGHLLRVIGLPGETVNIYGGKVYINGMVADEPYLPDKGVTYPYGDSDTFYLKNDEYFLMCDDRTCFDDSRAGRMFTREDIVSKALFAT